jgi:hypothetical protein
MSGNPNRSDVVSSTPVNIDGSQGGPATAVSTDICERVYRGVSLSSPKRNILSKLKVGDRLNLEIRTYKDSFVVFAVTASGEDAGTVISSSNVQIIKCIQQGYIYVAIVKTLDGGDCTLEIRMKG